MYTALVFTPKQHIAKIHGIVYNCFTVSTDRKEYHEAETSLLPCARTSSRAFHTSHRGSVLVSRRPRHHHTRYRIQPSERRGGIRVWRATKWPDACSAYKKLDRRQLQGGDRAHKTYAHRSSLSKTLATRRAFLHIIEDRSSERSSMDEIS